MTCLRLKFYKNSIFFQYTIIKKIFYFFLSILFKDRRYVRTNFLSFIKEDILILLISNFIIFSIYLTLNFTFIIGKEFIIINIIIISTLMGLHFYFNYLYKSLINKNIIQKNVMLVGRYSEIKKVLEEKFEKIFVFKCCMIIEPKDANLKFIKSEIKFPVFSPYEDIRSILEYHSLGQIWILNGDEKEKFKVFQKIIKYSVDTLNVKLNQVINLKGKKLLANKYDYDFYEWSRFYGVDLFIKI